MKCRAGAQGDRRRDARPARPVLIDFPKDLQLAPVPEPRRPPDAGTSAARTRQARGCPTRVCARPQRSCRTARRPVFYGGGGLDQLGPCRVRGFHAAGARDRCALHAHADGARRVPGSDPQFLGMLGMHGTLEANLAMHHADLVICVGARFDDRVTGRLERFLSPRQEDPSRHRSFVDQQAGARRRAAGRRLRRAAVRVAGGTGCAPRGCAAVAGLVGDDRRVAGAGLPAVRAARGLHRAAAAHARARPRPRRTRRDRLDRCRPAPDVGGAVSEVRPPAALADLGRRRHHGLRPAGRDRRPDRASATSWSSA